MPQDGYLFSYLKLGRTATFQILSNSRLAGQPTTQRRTVLRLVASINEINSRMTYEASFALRCKAFIIRSILRPAQSLAWLLLLDWSNFAVAPLRKTVFAFFVSVRTSGNCLQLRCRKPQSFRDLVTSGWKFRGFHTIVYSAISTARCFSCGTPIHTHTRARAHTHTHTDTRAHTQLLCGAYSWGNIFGYLIL
jgi:hypothetical protein